MKRSGATVSTDFSRLFSEQRERVRAQLARMVPASEVDDVLQEVFVRAARALPSFRGEAAPQTWLHRITQRTALDHLRSRAHHERQRTRALECEPTSEARSGGSSCGPGLAVPADAPGRLVESEMHGCIRDFVDRLAPEHATVLTLKDLEGLTNAEISVRLGITLDAAKIRLHRARAAMRALVDQGCELYRTPENTLACDRKTVRRRAH